MLAIIAVTAVGYVLLQGMNGSSLVVNAYSFETYCEDQIAYYSQRVEDTDENGDATEAAKHARRMVEEHQYLIDIGADWGDWRFSTGIVSVMLDKKYEENDLPAYQEIKAFLDKKDSAGYFLWEQKNAVAADPENEKIYEWYANYCSKNEVEPVNGDWRYALAEKVKSAKLVRARQEALQSADSPLFNSKELEEAVETELLGLYRLEHEIEYNPADSFASDPINDLLYGTDVQVKTGPFWDAMSNSASLITLIGLCMIVVAGGIVANEFASGTAKFLLLSPCKRWKILMAKYITVLLIGGMMMAVLAGLTFVSSIISFGFGDVLSPILSVKGGEVVTSSPYLRMLAEYILTGVEMVIMVTLAFAISSLSRSSSLAIGISLFFYLSGSLFVSILALFGCDWARYLIFANTDFAAIVNGNGLFPHQSLSAAIVIVVLHMIVLLLTAWDGFCKREV